MEYTEPSTFSTTAFAAFAFTAGFALEMAAELFVTLLATARFCFGAIMRDAETIDRNMRRRLRINLL